MKEIRKERTVTIEEVTFIADDGREFKVEGNITEESARKNCELHNKALQKEKLKREFDKLQLVKVYNVDDNYKWNIIGQVHNDEEWETLCLYLENTCYDADGLNVESDRPSEYPFKFVIYGDDDYCGIWSNYETYTDENGKIQIKYEEVDGKQKPIKKYFQPEQLLEKYKYNIEVLENHIATMNKSK
jgi:hypothetical protein